MQSKDEEQRVVVVDDQRPRWILWGLGLFLLVVVVLTFLLAFGVPTNLG